MRKTIKFILTITMLLFIITGCEDIKVDEKSKIESPKNNSIPIIGKYEIKDKVIRKTNINFNDDILTTAEFWDDYVRIGHKMYKNPKFKIKNVDANQYLIYSYKKTKEEFGIKKDKINVISIGTDEKYFCEVIEIDDKNIVLNTSEENNYMIKVDDNIKNKDIYKYEDFLNKEKNKNSSKEVRTTLLLGLRNKVKIKNSSGDMVDTYSYRTISIYSKNKEIKDVSEVKNLLVPRQSGFWLVKNYVYEREKQLKNKIESNPLNSEYYDNYSYKMIFNEYNRISFVNDNYLGIEFSLNGTYDNEKDTSYRMYSLDNLNKESLHILDIIENDQFINMKYIKKRLKEQDKIFDEYNYTMKRKNGYWAMIGKTYKVGDMYNQEDTLLNIIPSRGVLNYDDLIVSWNDIKGKIPLALDAYTSPNEDLLVVLTKNKILIYSLESKEISSKPIYELKLKDDEKSIMAEWATGNYAEDWNRVSKNIKILKKYEK